MNTTIKSTLTAVALITALGIASAGDAHSSQVYEYPTPELKTLVVRDLGAEFARCAAYYGLGDALAKRDWPSLDSSALERAYNLTNAMSVAMLGREAALAYFKLATGEMGRATQGDTNRMPIVIANFAPACQDLLDHPETHRDHWVAVEQAGIASVRPKAPPIGGQENPAGSGFEELKR